MLIEAIDEISKDRSRITLDTGEQFVLYKGELRLLKLKVSSEITNEMYRNIMEVVLPKRAKLRSMNLLKSKPYTEYQLTKKLRDGGYPEDVINEAVEYVKSYGYINDKQYALNFIREQTERRSKKELYQKLQQKGIGKEVLDAAFNETYGSYKDACEAEYDEKAVIMKTLKKKGFTGEETYEERQKLLSYFYRRGFDLDAVYGAMESYNLT